MQKYGKTTVLIYALLMLGGGIGAFASKHSLPSLISGIASFVLLIAAYSMIPARAKTGYQISMVVAIALTGIFVLRAVQTHSEASSMGRNIGLALLSLIVAAITGKSMQQSST